MLKFVTVVSSSKNPSSDEIVDNIPQSIDGDCDSIMPSDSEQNELVNGKQPSKIPREMEKN